VTSAAEEGALRFEPPGPGSYKQDPVHFPRAATRYWAETHPPAFARGTAEFARYFGMLIGGLEMASPTCRRCRRPRTSCRSGSSVRRR